MMSTRTFWILMLKIIGIWYTVLFMFQMIQIIAAFFLQSTLSGFPLMEMMPQFLPNFLMSALVFLLSLQLLVFNPNWLIKTLKLEKKLSDESLSLDFNLKPKTILTLSLMLIGGYMFFTSIPMFVQQIFAFTHQNQSFREFPDSSYLVLSVFKMIIGFALLNAKNTIEPFIDNIVQDIDQ